MVLSHPVNLIVMKNSPSLIKSSISSTSLLLAAMMNSNCATTDSSSSQQSLQAIEQARVENISDTNSSAREVVREPSNELLDVNTCTFRDAEVVMRRQMRESFFPRLQIIIAGTAVDAHRPAANGLCDGDVTVGWRMTLDYEEGESRMSGIPSQLRNGRVAVLPLQIPEPRNFLCDTSSNQHPGVSCRNPRTVMPSNGGTSYVDWEICVNANTVATCLTRPNHQVVCGVTNVCNAVANDNLRITCENNGNTLCVR